MTYISEVLAPSLGRPGQRSLTNLSPQLNIIYGPNGSGKSTLRDAVYFTLFGMPTARDGRTKKLTPSAALRRTYGGGGAQRHVGLVLTADNRSIVLDRQEASGSRNEGPPTVAQGSDEDYLSYVGSVGKEHYASIWMSSQTLLSEVDPSGDEGTAVLALLAQQYQTLVEPNAATSKITSSQKRFKATATGLKAMGKQLSTVRDSLAVAKGEAGEHTRLAGEIEVLADQLGEMDGQLTTLSAEHRGMVGLRQSLGGAMRDRATLLDALSDTERRLNQLTAEPSSDGETSRALLDARTTIARQGARRESIQMTRNSINQLRSRIAEIQIRLEPLKGSPPFTTEQEVSNAEGILSAPADRYRAAELRVLEAQHEAAGHGAVSADSQPHSARVALIGGGAAFLLSGVLATYLSGGITLPAIVMAAAIGTVVGGLLWLTASGILGAGTAPAAKEQLPITARAEASLAAAMQSWEAAVASIPELTDASILSPSNAPGMLSAARTRLALESELSEAQRVAADHAGAVAAWETEVRELYMRIYSVTEGESNQAADDLIEVLREAAEDAYTSSMTAATRVEQVRELTKDVETTTEKLTSLNALITEVTSQIGVSAEAAPDHIDRAIEGLEAQVGSLHQEKASIAERRGTILAEQRQYESDASVERLEAQAEGLSAEIVALAREYAVTEIAKTLIQNAREQYEEESTPSILARSSEVLSALTDGALRSIDLPEVNKVRVLTVTGDKGASLTIRELSDGERDQLYLAFRLGVLLALDDVGSDLPVLLDDVILSFDEDRRERACAVIAEFARHRQVLFFTCQEQLKDRLHASGLSAGVDTQVIELGVS